MRTTFRIGTLPAIALMVWLWVPHGAAGQATGDPAPDLGWSGAIPAHCPVELLPPGTRYDSDIGCAVSFVRIENPLQDTLEVLILVGAERLSLGVIPSAGVWSTRMRHPVEGGFRYRLHLESENGQERFTTDLIEPQGPQMIVWTVPVHPRPNASTGRLGSS